MKKLTIATALALSLGLAATGCKKKDSSRGAGRPGDSDEAESGGCCRASGPDGALLPLGLVVVGLAFISRRRRE